MIFHICILTATHSSSLDRLPMAELPICLVAWSCSTVARYFIQAGSWCIQRHKGVLLKDHGQRLLTASWGSHVLALKKMGLFLDRDISTPLGFYPDLGGQHIKLFY